MMARQRGVAMLESMIAVVILSIGLIGTLALQARTVVAMSDATLRAEATMAAERLIAQMFNDQANINDYVVAGGTSVPTRLEPWLASTRTAIPGATVSVTIAAGATASYRQVDIVISWTRKGSNANTHRISAHIASSQ